MQPLRYSDVARALDSFLGDHDPSDPATRKKLRIVEAATELFIRHGYRKASVDEIARRAGVAKGTVYLYFKNKTDLLVYAIALEKKKHLVVMKEVLDAEMPARERLRAYLRKAVALITEMPLTSRVMSGDYEIHAVLDDMDADARSAHRAMQMDFIERLLDPAAAPHRWTAEELSDRAQVVLGLIYSMVFMLDDHVRGDLTVERFGGILADVIVDGLCPGNPTRGGEA
jgi:AcrR family transcriptional regulator